MGCKEFKGEKGDTGLAGSTGLTGPKGAPGQKGMKGDKRNGGTVYVRWGHDQCPSTAQLVYSEELEDHIIVTLVVVVIRNVYHWTPAFLHQSLELNTED